MKKCPKSGKALKSEKNQGSCGRIRKIDKYAPKI